MLLATTHQRSRAEALCVAIGRVSEEYRARGPVYCHAVWTIEWQPRLIVNKRRGLAGSNVKHRQAPVAIVLTLQQEGELEGWQGH